MDGGVGDQCPCAGEVNRTTHFHMGLKSGYPVHQVALLGTNKSPVRLEP
jgi:hypothetical protein